MREAAIAASAPCRKTQVGPPMHSVPIIPSIIIIQSLPPVLWGPGQATAVAKFAVNLAAERAAVSSGGGGAMQRRDWINPAPPAAHQSRSRLTSSRLRQAQQRQVALGSKAGCWCCSPRIAFAQSNFDMICKCEPARRGLQRAERQTRPPEARRHAAQSVSMLFKSEFAYAMQNSGSPLLQALLLQTHSMASMAVPSCSYSFKQRRHQVTHATTALVGCTHISREGSAKFTHTTSLHTLPEDG